MRRIFNRELLIYFLCGLLAVLVNYVVFWIVLGMLGTERVLTVNVIAFIVATVFAFWTNKLLVFRTGGRGLNTALRELAMFFAARIASFGVEELGLWIAKDVVHAERYTLFGFGGIIIAKVLLLCISSLMNYIFSKFVIFRK